MPDTGSLRGDLAALRALKERDDVTWQALVGLLSELPHSPQLARVVQERIVGPRVALTRALLERARERGELLPGVDVELLAHVPTAMVGYRVLVTRTALDPTFHRSLSEDLLLPLAVGPQVPEPEGPTGP